MPDCPANVYDQGQQFYCALEPDHSGHHVNGRYDWPQNVVRGPDDPSSEYNTEPGTLANDMAGVFARGLGEVESRMTAVDDAIAALTRGLGEVELRMTALEAARAAGPTPGLGEIAATLRRIEKLASPPETCGVWVRGMGADEACDQPAEHRGRHTVGNVSYPRSGVTPGATPGGLTAAMAWGRGGTDPFTISTPLCRNCGHEAHRGRPCVTGCACIRY